MSWFGDGGKDPAKAPDEVPTPDSPRSLALYESQSCGYCFRVRRAIERLGLEVESRDVDRGREHRRDLTARTGRSTVPCLFIDGVPLFESADIVVWLEAYAAGGAPR